QPLQAAAGLAQGDGAQAAYGNQLTCMPADVSYRPPRRTPRPIISGLMTAHVDAAQLEDRAEIDDQGRYKLVMPFDLSGADPGKASRFVRKAQPYGGKAMGMHFPLHKGTEVICSFSNGDPDRPIIVGVVPNPETRSVVTAENSTRNVIRTPSGVMIEINDGRPKG
ncbi:MAG: phage baseplate assembly protein V, partial [Desulfatitalea sp.]